MSTHLATALRRHDLSPQRKRMRFAQLIRPRQVGPDELRCRSLEQAPSTLPCHE